MRLIVVLAVFILLPLAATSQSVRYGATLGILPSTTVSESHNFSGTGAAEGFTSRATYDAGVAALFPLSSSSTLHAVVKYSSRSVSTHRQGIADGDVFATLNFKYLSFISKVEYSPFAALLIGGGPVVDVNLRNELEASGDWVPVQNPIPGTNSVRFGVVLSIGYLLNIGDWFAVLPEFSYDFGLSKTSDIYGGRYSNTLFSISLFTN